jgi:hypothetical protein
MLGLVEIFAPVTEILMGKWTNGQYRNSGDDAMCADDWLDQVVCNQR